MVSRTGTAAWTLVAGRGNYAALYLFAVDADAGRGVSLMFGELGSTPFLARITRLR